MIGSRRAIVRVAATAALAGAGVASALGVATSSGAASVAPKVSGHVLLVGTFKGHKGQYTSIQSAVNAAQPGDWILVAPGDYHESADYQSPPSAGQLREGGFGSVLITKANLHLRGMDRNAVIVDGTSKTAPGSCSANAAYQQYGPVVAGSPIGRNGIVVYRANGVSIDNLTVCNMQSGSGDSGNGIWWNGGAGSGLIGLKGYKGSYLTATTTYFGGEQSASTYGIFSSNAQGPASWTTLYASNQNDSGMYVGACHQLCDITIKNAWMEDNALGYSGTNSGGAVVIEYSKFDHNEDGLDTNTAVAGDPPGPQNGACPNGAISPITHTHSCWVAVHNQFISNNNINTPRAGSAAAGPTGTGMTLSGGINDTVMDNTFTGNGAWGILFVPYPDSGTPVNGQTCTGDGGREISGFGCVFDPKNDALLHNTFKTNGSFKNPSNGDFGQLTLFGGEPQNCFVGNSAPDGFTPSNLQSAQTKCGVKTKAANNPSALFNQVLCDTGFGTCPAGANYPKPTGVVLVKLPTTQLKTMPNPCVGVPNNAWCVSGRPIA
jgi:hypothetical protein